MKDKMIELGCNYSWELLSLLNMGRVSVDWIKLSQWDVWREEFNTVRSLRPVLLHILPSAGDVAFGQPPSDEVAAAVLACGSPHIALHLSASRSRWPEPVNIKEVVEQLIKTSLDWKRSLPVPLLVENMTYYGKVGYLRCVSDPSVITEVCHQADVGLLLDLAHARIASTHRDENIIKYLEALPLERVQELHVNGPSIDPTFGLRDSHGEMQEEDYSLLSWLLRRISPRILTLEYGGTGTDFRKPSGIEALERQLFRLSSICTDV